MLGFGVQVWTGPGPQDRRVMFGPACAGVQAGRVFSGYPDGGIDSRIAGRSGTACLRFSIVVRTESWKMMKWN